MVVSRDCMGSNGMNARAPGYTLVEARRVIPSILFSRPYSLPFAKRASSEHKNTYVLYFSFSTSNRKKLFKFVDFSIPRCKRRSFRFHEIFNTIECAEEFPSFTNEKKLLLYSRFPIAIFKIFPFLSFYAVSEKKRNYSTLKKNRKGREKKE